MKIPRDLSGHRLATALCRHWGYVKVHQVGSHIILQTQEPSPLGLLSLLTPRCESEP